METFYILDKALLSLNQEEHKSFRKFLHSPYFRSNHARNKTVIKLYAEIKPYFTNKKRYSELNWDTVFFKIAKDDVSNSKNYVSKIKSELLYYILEFLSYESLHRNKQERKLLLLAELDRRALMELSRYYSSKHNKEVLVSSLEPEELYFSFKEYQLQIKLNERMGTDVSSKDRIKGYGLLLEYFKLEEERIFNKIHI